MDFFWSKLVFVLNSFLRLFNSFPTIHFHSLLDLWIDFQFCSKMCYNYVHFVASPFLENVQKLPAKLRIVVAIFLNSY